MCSKELSGPRNVLAISHRGKAIPYGGFGITRHDGATNYGFRDLKGRPEELDEIPELREDPALRSLVAAINGSATGLFSIGCLSAPVEDDAGFRMTGYIEWALNSKRAIADAAGYFPAFFHFDRMLHEQDFAERVLFHWQLAPAGFIEVGCDGFTAAITVNTDFYASRAEARACWGKSLAALERFLPEITVPAGDPICAPTTVGR